MTYFDVLVQVAAEITDQPKEIFIDLFDTIKSQMPRAALTKELSDKAARDLLLRLRTEKSGILANLIKSATTVTK